jgi:acetoin utilization protein AcuB
MFVRNWMSAPAITIPPVVPASAALGLMEKRKIRRLPVVEDGKLMGIVTQSDLVGSLGKGRKALINEDLSVADVMTRKPITVGQDDTLEEAAHIMITEKISGVPVMEGDRLSGIITESDLFRALCGMLGFGEKGARIIMTVRDETDLLQSIHGRLNGLAVRSLVTVHDPKREVWDVVMRVRGRLATKGSQNPGGPTKSTR